MDNLSQKRKNVIVQMSNLIIHVQKNKIDKNYQAEKNVMHPVKPAKQSSFKKKHISLYKDKNCKATISCKKQKKCEYADSNSHVSRNSDKNCQEKKIVLCGQ